MEPSTSGGGAPIPVVTGSPEPVDLYTRGRRGGVPAVDIALVNNMPDSAFAETERQFVSLLEAAAGPLEVRLDLYALPGLPRREATKRLVAERYRPFDELLTRRLDAAIITGTEPLAPTLMEEPYWADLEALVEWAAEATSSTVLSCLAAHAAVLLLDDVQRVLLNGKCHGVFTHEVAVDHPLVAGMTGPVPVPHSRLNDIPLESLPPSYVNLLPSDEVSWTVLAREQSGSMFVLVQGHPEYSTASLLREYRRDVLRHVRGERAACPTVPQGYLGAEGERLLAEYTARVTAPAFHGDAAADFPFDLLSAELKNSWRQPGERLYANWINEVLQRRYRDASVERGAQGRASESEGVGSFSA